MGKLIQSLEKQLTEKGEEINAYMEKYNIQVKDQQGGKKEEGKGDDKGKGKGKENLADKGKSKRKGVAVSPSTSAM